MKKNELQLPSGKLLERGTWIKLSDRMGEDYKKTKNWDVSIEHSIQIEENSARDFQFVKILPLSQAVQTPIITHRMFSFFEDEILGFEKRNGLDYCYTKYLEIEIAKAFEHQEVEVLDKAGVSYAEKERQLEIELIEDIQQLEEDHSLALLSSAERKMILEDRIFFYFNTRQKKWKLNYSCSITGKWYKKETFE